MHVYDCKTIYEMKEIPLRVKQSVGLDLLSDLFVQSCLYTQWNKRLNHKS